MDNTKNVFPVLQMIDTRVLPEQVDWVDALRDTSKVTIRLWPDDDAEFDNAFIIDDKSSMTRAAINSQKKLVMGVAANGELAKKRQGLTENFSMAIYRSPFRLTALNDRHFIKEAVDDKAQITHHATLIAVSVPAGMVDQYVMMKGGRHFSIKHAESDMEHYWFMIIGSKDNPLTFMYHNPDAAILTKIRIADQLAKQQFDLKDMTPEEVTAKMERMAQKANIPPTAPPPQSAPLTQPTGNGAVTPVAAK